MKLTATQIQRIITFAGTHVVLTLFFGGMVYLYGHADKRIFAYAIGISVLANAFFFFQTLGFGFLKNMHRQLASLICFLAYISASLAMVAAEHFGAGFASYSTLVFTMLAPAALILLACFSVDERVLDKPPAAAEKSMS